MRVTSKCNRVWNKQEKRIDSLLYRKRVYHYGRYKERKWFIKYLAVFPAVRCDSKIYKI